MFSAGASGGAAGMFGGASAALEVRQAFERAKRARTDGAAGEWWCDEGDEDGEGEQDEEDELGITHRVSTELEADGALLRQLKLEADSITNRISGGDGRVFARFHAMIRRAVEADDRDAVAKLCLALSVLRDPERRRIYLQKGMAILRQSENYSEVSVFDQDPGEVVDWFYSGAALVPNVRGLERALATGLPDASIWVTGSEAFSSANVNMTIAQHRGLNREIAAMARDAGVQCRGYVSCALHCPFDGQVDPILVQELAAELLDLGCYEVSLCDTTGRAGLVDWATLLEAVLEVAAPEQLAIHLHNTCGQAMACILLALGEYSVTSIEASVAGLGGCPYAPGASGNVATEDVVYLLHSAGVSTGVDLERLLHVSRWVSAQFDGCTDSSVAQTMGRLL